MRAGARRAARPRTPRRAPRANPAVAALPAVAAERLPDRLDVVARRRLVEGHPERARVDDGGSSFRRHATLDDPRRRVAGRDDDRVEEMGGRHDVAQPLETRLKDRRQPMHAPRDGRQARRAVIDRVHARDHGEQHLRRADVRRRLLAADVLLARLQCEAVRRTSVRVDGDADEAAGHRALEVVARREVARVRAAIADRHAEALRRADDDVGAPFARRRQQREREEVGGDDDMPACRVHRGRSAR